MMPGKSRKTTSKKSAASATTSAGRTSKKKPSASMSEDVAASAQNKYVADVLTRQEAAPLKGGKLPLGKTHILKKDKDGVVKVTRARFTLA
jgi:hypothetical protein